MKTAVIIKGNPKFVASNPDADRFYADLKAFLEGLGFSVSFDAGEPYTSPPAADLWIGHSRGSDRLQYAPAGTITVALGTLGGINHSDDNSLSPGQVPDISHYILTQEMKEEIKSVLERYRQSH